MSRNPIGHTPVYASSSRSLTWRAVVMNIHSWCLGQSVISSNTCSGGAGTCAAAAAYTGFTGFPHLVAGRWLRPILAPGRGRRPQARGLEDHPSGDVGTFVPNPAVALAAGWERATPNHAALSGDQAVVPFRVPASAAERDLRPDRVHQPRVAGHPAHPAHHGRRGPAHRPGRARPGPDPPQALARPPAMCASTVRSAMTRRPAMAVLECPSATRASTSRSRSDRRAITVFGLRGGSDRILARRAAHPGADQAARLLLPPLPARPAQAASRR